MKSGVIGGVIGSLMGVLFGAAAFRAGAPVDARFTYQGQIRDGEALVSGNVDIRFSLWDSPDGGLMIGSALTKTSLPVSDGRFATELDFGTSAFSGDARWIQMEFRSPAGTGQYTALAPRQRVNAVPYALYSLNGGLSPWNLDVASRDIGYANGRVGIGTNSPTAALEVVSVSGGDESVKLPAGSIGPTELAANAMSTSAIWSGEYRWGPGTPAGWSDVISTTINLDEPATLAMYVSYSGMSTYPVELFIDGRVVAQLATVFGGGSVEGASLVANVPLTAGSHAILLRYSEYWPAFSSCPNCNSTLVGSASILAIKSLGELR
jgi:hypothetical protein